MNTIPNKYSTPSIRLLNVDVMTQQPVKWCPQCNQLESLMEEVSNGIKHE